MHPNPDSANGIGLVLLAAGGSVRLGQPKQLVKVGGATLLRRTAQAAHASACRPLVAVLGADAGRMGEELRGLDFQSIDNAQWQSGMGSSVRLGLQALLAAAPHLDAVVFAVCDQPYLSADVLNSLVRVHRVDGASLAACAYGSAVGVPALFGSAYFAELLALPDDSGARQVLRRHAPIVTAVPFPEGLTDIDTPEDMARLRRSTQDSLPLA